MKTPVHDKAVERSDLTDISTDAIAQRVAYLRRNSINDMDADLFEALAADRDRLAKERDDVKVEIEDAMVCMINLTDASNRLERAAGEMRKQFAAANARAEKAESERDRLAMEVIGKIKPRTGPWYLGAMNDATFIIDKPPSPAMNDVGPYVMPDGPSPISAAIDDRNGKLIVAAHNAAIANAEDSAYARGLAEGRALGITVMGG